MNQLPKIKSMKMEEVLVMEGEDGRKYLWNGKLFFMVNNMPTKKCNCQYEEGHSFECPEYEESSSSESQEWQTDN